MPPKKKITIRSKSKKAVPKLKDIEETSKLLSVLDEII